MPEGIGHNWHTMKERRKTDGYRAPSPAFTLTVLGYQFPNKQWKGEWDHDANWLMLRLDACDGVRSWSATSAAMTTWDLLDFSDWMQLISDGQRPALDTFVGLDGTLFITLEAHRPATFTVDIREQFRPPDIVGDGPVDVPAFRVEATVEQIRAQIALLHEGIRRFPVRGGPPRSSRPQ